MIVRILLLSLLVTACMPGQQPITELEFEDKRTDTAEADFKSVNQLLKSRCISCHNASFARSGINLQFRTEDQLLASNLIVNGSPMESHLYKSLRGIEATAMPPSGSLSSDEIELVSRYITSLAAADTQAPAILSVNRSYFDPRQVNAGITCLKDGKLTLRVEAGDVVSDTEVTCVKNETQEILVPISTAAETARLSLRATSEIAALVLQKIKPVSSAPADSDSCSGTDEIVPKFRLKRLSYNQLTSILSDVLKELGVDAGPAMEKHKGYLISDVTDKSLLGTDFHYRTDLQYSKGHVEGIYFFFQNVITELEKTPGFANAVETSQCPGFSRGQCADKIVDLFTQRLMRGQLDAITVASLKSDAATFQTNYDVIIGLIEFAFIHPRFGFELFLKDLGTDEVLELTDEELFHKTFLTLFNTIPTMAQLSDWYLSGVTPDIYAMGLISSQVEMRTKFSRTMKDFFSGWLGLDNDAEVRAHTYRKELNEVLPGVVPTVFRTQSAGALADALAASVASGTADLRGLHFWDSSVTSGLPFSALLDFGGGELSLASLPPLLSQYGEFNNIFKRGSFFYKRFMCGDFSDIASPGDVALDEAAKAGHGTRSFFEELTPKGSTCFACHQRFNGIGMTLEEFGVTGARRSDGREYQYDATGTVTSAADIRTDAHVNYLGEFYYTPDFRTLFETLYDKGVIRKCTTKQLGQFFLRMRNVPENKCALEKLNSATSDNILEIVQTIITSPAFKKVRL